MAHNVFISRISQPGVLLERELRLRRSSKKVPPTSDGGVFALGLADGREGWRTSIADLKCTDDRSQHGEVYGMITLDERRALLTLVGGHVVALDARSGRRQWVREAVADHGYFYDDTYFVLDSLGCSIVGLDTASGPLSRTSKTRCLLPRWKGWSAMIFECSPCS